MTLPRLAALNRYWKKHPPAHLLLAAQLGYRAPDEAPKGDFSELIALAGAPPPARRRP